MGFEIDPVAFGELVQTVKSTNEIVIKLDTKMDEFSEFRVRTNERLSQGCEKFKEQDIKINTIQLEKQETIKRKIGLRETIGIIVFTAVFGMLLNNWNETRQARNDTKVIAKALSIKTDSTTTVILQDIGKIK